MELLEVKNLTRRYRLSKSMIGSAASYVQAVDNVSFTIKKGECLGLVGESGCGKSTLSRMITVLDRPTSGDIFFKGQDVFKMSESSMGELRTDLQMVFQDPFASLNPRRKIGLSIAEPLFATGVHEKSAKARQLVSDALEAVGLRADDAEKYPHAFSGGQRQRIAIARAIIGNPSLVVADEPVSALDVSIQAQVLNLLMELQQKFELAYLFVSHDLSVVQLISHRVMVMYRGVIVEEGPTQRVLQKPHHPYTQTLLDASPSPDKRNQERNKRVVVEPNDEASRTSGSSKSCPYLARCLHRGAKCEEEKPSLTTVGECTGHRVACFYPINASK